MDFASLMSAQIAKSKQPSSSSTDKPKYLRRSDLEAARTTSYLSDQARLESERAHRAAQKRKAEDDANAEHRAREEKKQRLAEESRVRREEETAAVERLRRKRLGLPEVAETLRAEAKDDDTKNEADANSVDIPEAELLALLRGLEEPAILFGETHSSRLRRYRTLTRPKPTPQIMTTGPIPTTLQPIPASAMILPAPPIPARNTEPRAHLFRQITSYLTLILREWSLALSARTPATKASQAGSQASANYTTTLAYLTPLFRRLETDSPTDLPPSLLDPLIAILRACQARKYVTANDGYLKLSIGTAAWPIGVTMVGIHERSAREKLHESEDGRGGRIMSDEVTRKMLQGVKRCISYAQVRWPPEEVGELMG